MAQTPRQGSLEAGRIYLGLGSVKSTCRARQVHKYPVSSHLHFHLHNCPLPPSSVHLSFAYWLLFFLSLNPNMRSQSILLLASAASILATPLPQGRGGGADSCPADALDPATWTSLDIDSFLKGWVEANFTAPAAGASSIQALAATFGAPNFFWYVM